MKIWSPFLASGYYDGLFQDRKWLVWVQVPNKRELGGADPRQDLRNPSIHNRQPHGQMWRQKRLPQQWPVRDHSAITPIMHRIFLRYTIINIRLCFLITTFTCMKEEKRERENYIYSLIHVSIRVFIISFPIWGRFRFCWASREYSFVHILN